MPTSSADSSAILALPYLQPSQAQKHVTHNEALRRLDVLVQLAVESFGAETPPADPVEGEVHALGVAPTGAWAGQGGMLAAWADGIWQFIAPQAGWRAWGRTEADLRVWTGTTWAQPHGALDDLNRLGIGTTADATNRLAVKSAATLLSHDGAGHQVKINKATVPDTASLLFQSGWTGHAEIGLAGSTDLSFKVSGDGSTWAEALTIDGTGRVGIGTPTPTASLDVTGDAAVSSNLKVRNLAIESNTAGVTSDIALTANAVIGAESSLTHTMEAGGHWRWMTGATDAAGGTAGATEVARLDGSGNFLVGTNTSDARLRVTQSGATDPALKANASSAAYTTAMQVMSCSTAASSAYQFMTLYSGGGDLEFKLRGDGVVTADGSFTGGGADYAEYFEWADGNPQGEDRRGVSVVLVGDRIRAARPGDDPFGVVSANPSVIGDGDMDRWKCKYLRDEYGSSLWEDYDVVEWVEKITETDPETGEAVTRDVQHSYASDAVPDGVTVPPDAVRTTQQRRKLNPDYDPDRDYTPRAERPEWATVGLMGKIRLRRGQPVGDRWIKMRKVSEGVEEWLVR